MFNRVEIIINSNPVTLYTCRRVERPSSDTSSNRSAQSRRSRCWEQQFFSMRPGVEKLVPYYAGRGSGAVVVCEMPARVGNLVSRCRHLHLSRPELRIPSSSAGVFRSSPGGDAGCDGRNELLRILNSPGAMSSQNSPGAMSSQSQQPVAVFALGLIAKFWSERVQTRSEAL